MSKYHENTATRLRPKSFKQLVGQEFIVSTICNSIDQSYTTKQSIAPAYLFSGPRGVGKTSAARLVALAINRPENTDIENLFYEGSEDIRLGKSLDVIEIDGASYTSIENIRKIQEDVSYAPVHFKYKVFIIDEVHMLSNSAFNALLKTIEEPPSYVIFIFATTELHKVPATIKSRCQQFSFRLIKNTEIVKQLSDICEQENIQADPRALQWIAKESQGSFRDAYTIFDQVKAFSNNTISLETIEEQLGLTEIDVLNKIFLTCLEGNRTKVLQQLDEVLAKGVSTEQFVMDSAEYVRNLLFLKSELTSSELLGVSADLFDNTIYAGFSMEQLEKALSLLLECYRNLRYSVNTRFEIELVFGQFCELSHYITPQELVAQLKQAKASSMSSPEYSPEDLPKDLPDTTAEQTTASPQTTHPQNTSTETSETQPVSQHISLQTPSVETLLEEHNISRDTETSGSSTGSSIGSSAGDTTFLWDEIISHIRNSNEGFALVLGSASVKYDGHILSLSFHDDFSYKKYEAYADRVKLLADKIANTEITINATLVQNAQTTDVQNGSQDEGQNNKQTDEKNNSTYPEFSTSNHIETEIEQSEEASNILGEFGGEIT